MRAHAAPASPEDIAQRLGDDGAGHLTLALTPVGEDDGDLGQARAVQIALIGRLDQKAVAHHVDGPKVDRRQRLAAVAFIAPGAVAHARGHHIARAVRRSIVDHEYIRLRQMGQDGVEQLGDVFTLVVGWDDDQWRHSSLTRKKSRTLASHTTCRRGRGNMREVYAILGRASSKSGDVSGDAVLDTVWRYNYYNCRGLPPPTLPAAPRFRARYTCED